MPEIFTSNQIKKQLNIQFYGPAHSTDSAFWVDSERLENEAKNRAATVAHTKQRRQVRRLLINFKSISIIYAYD